MELTKEVKMVATVDFVDMHANAKTANISLPGTLKKVVPSAAVTEGVTLSLWARRAIVERLEPQGRVEGAGHNPGAGEGVS